MSQPSPSEPAASEEAPKKRRIPWVVFVVVACLVAYVLYVFASNSGKALTDDATITTDVAQITPLVGGKIVELPVSESEDVKAGQVLARIEDSNYKDALEQAQANLEVAKAAELSAGRSVQLAERTGSALIEQAAGGIGQADAGVVTTESDVKRTQAAVDAAKANRAGAVESIASAQAAVKAAQSNQNRAEAQVLSAESLLEAATDGVGAAKSNLESAEAASDKATKDAVRMKELLQEQAASQAAMDAASAAETSMAAAVQGAVEQVKSAKAMVRQRTSDVEAARQQADAAKQAVVQAKAQLQAARKGVDSLDALVRQSEAQVNSTQDQVKFAEARRRQAQGALSQASTKDVQVSVAQANYLTAQAKTRQAEAAVQDAKLNVERTVITAPISGKVGRKYVQLGQAVTTTQPLMSLVRTDNLWVTANFKETDIKDVRVGQKAEVDVDEYSGVHLKGHVDSIAGGTGSTFSLLPADNSTGNFIKVVQRVPVKIVLEPGELSRVPLRSGLSVNVTIFTKGG